LTTKSAVFLPDHRERLPDEVHEADRSQIVIQQSETIQFPCVSFFGFFREPVLANDFCFFAEEN
jgi:hypothetical protein